MSHFSPVRIVFFQLIQYLKLTWRHVMIDRKFLFKLTLIMLLGFNLALGQSRNEATDKGASIISGMFSLSSQGGDLYEWEGERFNTFQVTPSLIYFIAPGIGLGADISYERMSQGGDSFTTWGAGPKIGYFIDSGSNTIPFVAGSFNYLDFDDGDNGLRIKLGGGLMIRKGHLGVSVEANYSIDRIKYEFSGMSDSISGNSFGITVGFAGFLH